MVNKINCPDCSKPVAEHTVICPFCNAKIKSQEEIDNDPQVQAALAGLKINELKMQSSTPKKN